MIFICFLSFIRLMFFILRREGDSNPRYPLGVYTLSRRASSTTRASLLFLFNRHLSLGFRALECFQLQMYSFFRSHVTFFALNL